MRPEALIPKKFPNISEEFEIGRDSVLSVSISDSTRIAHSDGGKRDEIHTDGAVFVYMVSTDKMMKWIVLNIIGVIFTADFLFRSGVIHAAYSELIVALWSLFIGVMVFIVLVNAYRIEIRSPFGKAKIRAWVMRDTNGTDYIGNAFRFMLLIADYNGRVSEWRDMDLIGTQEIASEKRGKIGRYRGIGLTRLEGGGAVFKYYRYERLRYAFTTTYPLQMYMRLNDHIRVNTLASEAFFPVCWAVIYFATGFSESVFVWIMGSWIALFVFTYIYLIDYDCRVTLFTLIGGVKRFVIRGKYFDDVYFILESDANRG